MKQVTAQEKAETLCTELGDGWTPHVWNNLIWHWEVKNGDLPIIIRESVNELLGDRYIALVPGKFAAGGSAKEALTRLVTTLQEEIDNSSTLLAAIREVIV